MRKLLLLVFWLLAALPASGQLTNVSATVTDGNGIPYANGTVKAQIVFTAGGAATGQPTVTVSSAQQCASAGKGSAPCQIEFSGTVGPFTLDATGSFNVALQDNVLVTPAATQWLFTIQHPGEGPPYGTGPISFTSQITITGASQSISATLSAASQRFLKSLFALTVQDTNFTISGFGTNNFSIGAAGVLGVVQIFGRNTRIGSGNGTDRITTGLANTDFQGVLTCAAGTVVKTFSQAFSSTPVIVISDETTSGGARVSAKSASSFTVTCVGATDVVDYLVIGNPN